MRSVSRLIADVTCPGPGALSLIASAKMRHATLARPEGIERAMQTLRVNGVEELVDALRVA
jgi:hypothetical protein